MWSKCRALLVKIYPKFNVSDSPQFSEFNLEEAQLGDFYFIFYFTTILVWLSTLVWHFELQLGQETTSFKFEHIVNLFKFLQIFNICSFSFSDVICHNDVDFCFIPDSFMLEETFQLWTGKVG